MQLAAGAGMGLVGGIASQALGRAFAPQVDANQFQSPLAQGTAAGQRVEDQISQMNAMDQQVFRNAQIGQLGQLQAMAQGQGPSIAEQMGAQQAQAAMAQQIAQAQGARGINAGMAQRLAMQNTAQAQQGIGAQTQLARLQEIEQANRLLTGALQAGRGQDINTQGMAQNYEQLLADAALKAQQQKLGALELNMGSQQKTAAAFGSAMGGGLAGAAQMFGK